MRYVLYNLSIQLSNDPPARCLEQQQDGEGLPQPLLQPAPRFLAQKVNYNNNDHDFIFGHHWRGSYTNFKGKHKKGEMDKRET